VSRLFLASRPFAEVEGYIYQYHVFQHITSYTSNILRVISKQCERSSISQWSSYPTPPARPAAVCLDISPPSNLYSPPSDLHPNPHPHCESSMQLHPALRILYQHRHPTPQPNHAYHLDQVSVVASTTVLLTLHSHD
jgi:hypothetical protein